MILIAGGTGTLGREVVRRLRDRGLPLRVLTRDPSRAEALPAEVEVVVGDVRDPAAVARAMAGVETVVSAIQGFAGPGEVSPETVDWQGNHNMIQHAVERGVDSFVLLSVQGASADHPMSLMRMKARAEQELAASSLSWTIIRPTAYMETWVTLLAQPLAETGKTRIFGRGRNPINYVSAHDVAQFVELAVTDPGLRGKVIEVGGPENLTAREVVARFQQVTGVRGQVSAVPLSLMRVMSVVMRPIKPALARQITAGVVMDTHDLRFDPQPQRDAFPHVHLTPLAEMIRRDYPLMQPTAQAGPTN